MSAEHFFVTTDVLPLSEYVALATDDAFGAVASFVGTVRSPNFGEQVLFIDYEGYDAMIVKQMQVVANELRAQFELGHIVLAHRLGRCYPSEASIAIVISSVHRKEALAACEVAINRAKELLPVWKHEATPQGERWVEGSSVASQPL